MSGFFVGSCGHADTEIHEILHTLNFGHNLNNKSIMFAKTEQYDFRLGKRGKCLDSDVVFDDYIIEELKSLYGEG